MRVYFAKAQRSGLIKIGHASNIRRRIKTLNTSSPEEIILLFSLPETAGKFTEALFHERFKEYRVKGEWFLPDGDLLDFISSPPPPNNSYVFPRSIVINTPGQLAAVIHAVRLRREMTQAELAKAAGVSRVFVCELERGKPRAQQYLVFCVIRALHIKLGVTNEII